MTHEAKERDLLSSLQAIDNLAVVRARSIFIRIEEL